MGTSRESTVQELWPTRIDRCLQMVLLGTVHSVHAKQQLAMQGMSKGSRRRQQSMGNRWEWNKRR